MPKMTTGLPCPKCGALMAVRKTITSGATVRRWRQCPCGHAMWTTEEAAMNLYDYIHRDLRGERVGSRWVAIVGKNGFMRVQWCDEGATTELQDGERSMRLPWSGNAKEAAELTERTREELAKIGATV